MDMKRLAATDDRLRPRAFFPAGLIFQPERLKIELHLAESIDVFGCRPCFGKGLEFLEVNILTYGVRAEICA
jgi:hypothetical protein